MRYNNVNGSSHQVNDLEEFKKIFEAFKDGKTIQTLIMGQWYDVRSDVLPFDTLRCVYRIKPEEVNIDGSKFS